MSMRFAMIMAIVLGATLSCPDEKWCLGCSIDGGKNNQCSYCEYGFVNKNTKKCDSQVSRKIDNCREYAKGDPSICLYCDFGYDSGKNDKGESVCVPCSAKDCAQCTWDTQMCTACFTPNLLKDVGDAIECTPQSVEVFPHCRISQNSEGDEEEKCLLCIGSHMLTTTGKCVEDKFGNCWFGESDEKACRVCRWGHFLSKDGKCVKNEFAPEDKTYRREIIMLSVFVILVLAFVATYFICWSKKRIVSSYEQPILAN